MIFPLGTDRELTRRPWVNYALIGLNVFIFLFTERRLTVLFDVQRQIEAARLNSQPWIADYVRVMQDPLSRLFLYPDRAELFQYLTYPFLHQNLLHLIGNMAFLLVFGNAVEDRMGRVGYLAFYLGGGVVAGMAHVLTSDAPVLGASGAVAAVTGAFLVFFPRTEVTLGYWLIVPGTFAVLSVWVILLRVAQDALFHLFGIGYVAYTAHLAGYAFGFAVAAAILLLGLAPRERYDLFSVLNKRRRDAHFARERRAGRAPWSPAARQTPLPESDPRAAAVRRALAAGADSDAAETYLQILHADADASLPLKDQLRVADRLYGDAEHHAAARAYELLLQHQSEIGAEIGSEKGSAGGSVSGAVSGATLARIHLILGLTYARWIPNAERARELLAAARPHLSAAEIAEADAALARL